MPVASASNNWVIGIDKQTSEGTIATTSDYTIPVFSGRPQPVQTINRVEVTDAASVVGDPYKAGDEHWTADLVFPGFAAPLGTFLVSMWPTDTVTGAGPYTHTFSGLGNSTAWFSLYSDPLSGALDETFEDGKCTGITFSNDASGGPLRVGVQMIGKRPTVAAWTAGGSASLNDGYFQAKGATLKYEVDNATPATETNVQDFAISVTRPGTPVPTADSTSVSIISQGRVEPTFTMTLVYDDWDAYRATFYGAAAGSTPSLTIVEGSVEMNWIHTVQGGWSFKITIPSAVLAASPPQPDPSGSPLLVPITGYATTPGSGSHIQPVLINAVSSAY
jgi:hypothetical protein